MSLYLVEGAGDPWQWRPIVPFWSVHAPWPAPPRLLLRDASDHDGAWLWLRGLLPLEVVEYDGYRVPLYRGDVERAEWWAGHVPAHGRPRWKMRHGVSMFGAWTLEWRLIAVWARPMSAHFWIESTANE